MSVIIVGTGLAGYTTAKEFRKADSATPLTLITRDDGAVYSKPMLSNAFGTNKTPEQLITHSSAQMAETLHATVVTRTTVERIDLAHRTLITNTGSHRYAQLVLALGAEPVRPPFASVESGVHSVNNWGDYARFRTGIAGKKHIALIGAGLIGCEFANDLRRGGYEVTLIAPDTRPLSHLLPPELSEDLRNGLQQIGVRWCLGSGVARVEQDGPVSRVFLESGMMITADAVLSAVGLRPNTALATQAGLKTNRGIETDEFLRCSDPQVYALGDCAQVCGQVLPFVLPIMSAAKALGQTLAGQPTRVHYPAMPVVIKTPACPLVVSPPPVGSEGSWTVERLEKGSRALFNSADGKLLGIALSGDCTKERQMLAKELPALL